MKKLSARGQRWLKCLHLYFAAVWVGCATVLTIMQFFTAPDDGSSTYGLLSTLDFIDHRILVPGAIGTFLTALVYSIWTNWGWFKHKWITVKWIICMFGMIFGTFWLGPWIVEMAAVAEAKGVEALNDSVYIANRNKSLIFGTLQTGTVIFALFISTLKPWRKKK